MTGFNVPDFLPERAHGVRVMELAHNFTADRINADGTFRRKIGERNPAGFGSRLTGPVARFGSMRPPGNRKSVSIGGVAIGGAHHGKHGKAIDRRRQGVRLGIDFARRELDPQLMFFIQRP